MTVHEALTWVRASLNERFRIVREQAPTAESAWGAIYAQMDDDAQETLAAEVDRLTAENATLRTQLAEAQARIDKGMDYTHHTSCGHTWTMRHTACPICFAEIRDELAQRREAWDKLHAWRITWLADASLEAYDDLTVHMTALATWERQ